MKTYRNPSVRSGIFMISPDQKANGTLTLAGPNTSLYIWDDNSLEISSGTTITGILDDLSKVSLIKCIITNQSSVRKQDGILYKCNLFPTYVIIGDRYFCDEEDHDIHEISFIIDDAKTLFHDTDAFGTVYNEPEILEQIVQLDNPDREIVIGESNWVSYYTGKTNIFTSGTKIGRVSADHSPVFSIGIYADSGPRSDTFVNIKFEETITVIEALSRMGRVLQFFGLIIGRPQNILKVNIHTGYDYPPQVSDVYVSIYPEHQRSQEEGEPTFYDILIDPIKNPEIFASVLEAWLNRDMKWRTARARLSRVWSGRDYSYDRIIAAANVFDLLPSDEYGNKESLPENLSDAVEKAKKIFRGLPQSDEKNDILGHLGRVGGWRLKKKIRHRSKSITDTINHLVPEIEIAIDEAVNLRNFYVHGAPPRLDSDQHSQFLGFLTNSLEFLFFASDLVDTGWDIVSWCRKSKPRGHPFHNYLVDYESNLIRLKSAINQ